MPLQKLQFKSGVNRENTSLTSEGTWYETQWVRFRSGYPEKIGGWIALTTAAWLGTCRSLWNWITLRQYNLLGIGTHLKFFIGVGGAYFDITPIEDVKIGTIQFFADTSAPFSTYITVVDSGAPFIKVGNYVIFSNAVSLGGNITAAIINQEYEILTKVNDTTYVIQARGVSNLVTPAAPVESNSSDTGRGGGAVIAAYELDTGYDIYTNNTGWGTGFWGRNGWGEGFTTGFSYQLRLWSQANYGQDLLFCPRLGPLCWWTPGDTATIRTSNRGLIVHGFLGTGSISGTTLTIATVTAGAIDIGTILTDDTGLIEPGTTVINYVSGIGGVGTYTVDISQSVALQDMRCDVPLMLFSVQVSESNNITIGYGANPFNQDYQDPLLVRWTAVESFRDWTPTATNQAGDFRLSKGSKIVATLQSRQEILVWTDVALYSQQYLGPPLVWGFNLVADNISIISPNAVATASGMVFWMGVDKFYKYSGRVETLDCKVRKYIFDNISLDQSYQVFGGTNEGYNEVWWFYCSESSTAIDRYVIYNYLEDIWYYGNMSRTSWLDSGLNAGPLATTLNNIMVTHEFGCDDATTDPPTPVPAYIQSADFDIDDGHNYSMIWRIIPDVTFDGSTTRNPQRPSVTMQLRPKQNPGAAYNVAPSPRVTSAQSYNTLRQYTVQEFTQIIYTRVRGRSMAFKIGSDGIGVKWQLGSPRMDIRPDGRR